MSTLTSIAALWLLIFARFTPLVTTLPLLGGAAVPTYVRTANAGAFATTLTAFAAPVALPPIASIHFLILLADQLLYGILLAFLLNLPTTIFHMTGQYVDLFRGSTLANTINPHIQVLASPVAKLLQMLAISIGFLSFAHVYALMICAESLVHAPVTHPAFLQLTQTAAYPSLIINPTAVAIKTALLLSLPILFTVLLTDIILAFVNRSVPQINVFFLGMPIKALLGIAILTTVILPTSHSVRSSFSTLYPAIQHALFSTDPTSPTTAPPTAITHSTSQPALTPT